MTGVAAFARNWLTLAYHTMKLAFPNVSGEIFALDADLLRRGIEASRESPRRRMILPIHRRQDDPVQRLLNFLQPGTYLRPHAHLQNGASETIFVMQGAIGFVSMNENGSSPRPVRLVSGGLLDIIPGVWHTLLALESDTVILEIKRGPYSAEEDKVFAPWAPPEGHPSAPAFLARYRALFEQNNH